MLIFVFGSFDNPESWLITFYLKCSMCKVVGPIFSSPTPTPNYDDRLFGRKHGGEITKWLALARGWNWNVTSIFVEKDRACPALVNLIQWPSRVHEIKKLDRHQYWFVTFCLVLFYHLSSLSVYWRYPGPLWNSLSIQLNKRRSLQLIHNYPFTTFLRGRKRISSSLRLFHLLNHQNQSLLKVRILYKLI